MNVVLGSGGTIARHAEAGDQVQVLIVAEGATSRFRHRDRPQADEELSTLAKSAQRAGSILGAAGFELLDLPVKRLLSFEVVSSTEWQPQGSASAFHPTWFVDISAQWQRNREALEAYDSEMRPSPNARSLRAVEHLARWRGVQVGVEAAEAFCLLRQLG